MVEGREGGFAVTRIGPLGVDAAAENMYLEENDGGKAEVGIVVRSGVGPTVFRAAVVDVEGNVTILLPVIGGGVKGFGVAR